MESSFCKPFQNKLGSNIVLCFLALSTIFILSVLRSPDPFSVIRSPKQLPTHAAVPPSSPDSGGSAQHNESKRSVELLQGEIQNRSTAQPVGKREEERACDLFTGRWVRDAKGSIYTNATCATLPDLRNCGKHGKEQRYVYWRWKPHECELPMFDPLVFLRAVRGKKLMFIGDSLARNQMESLLCLLSQAETPIDKCKDANDKHRTWYFPSHDFTLMVIWTEFFVESAEIIVNGTASNTFTINLDRMNPIWADKLPELNYAVINGGNWFTRRTYIHKAGKLIGCVHCWGENIPSISVESGIRMVFKAALNFINRCEQCSNLLTVLRTYSMSHFEHGSWMTGGYCNRTQPLSEGDLSPSNEAWEFRRIQMEEMATAKGLGMKRLELMDVTMAMMMRADAHPGRHWIAKVASDCLHWCLPGPIDMWNELLLEIIKKNA